MALRRTQFSLCDPTRRAYWSPDQDRLLGTLPDAQIAHQLHRSRNAVKLRRLKLKIPAWQTH